MLQANLHGYKKTTCIKETTKAPQHEPQTTHNQQRHLPISSHFSTHLYVWYPRRKQLLGWLINPHCITINHLQHRKTSLFQKEMASNFFTHVKRVEIRLNQIIIKISRWGP